MPRCSRCVAVWGKKKGIGIGHNARNKACPASTYKATRTNNVRVYGGGSVIATMKEKVLEKSILELGCKLKQEKNNHQSTKKELALHEVTTKDVGVCSVCMERSNTHIFYPCLHQCVCAVCAVQIEGMVPSRCPICRTGVLGSGKVHLV